MLLILNWPNSVGEAWGKMRIYEFDPEYVVCKIVGSYRKVLSYLEDLITKMENPNQLTYDLHIWPDFHGNRLLADPTLKGMVCGLTLSSSVNDLAALYLATIQALAVMKKNA